MLVTLGDGWKKRLNEPAAGGPNKGDIQARVWRTRRGGQVLSGGLCLVLGLGAIYLQIVEEQVFPFAGLAIACALGLGWWLLSLRPFIAVDVCKIVVRNPLRTITIPTSQVLDLYPGYSGIRIERPTGRPVHAWAVQKTNIATMLSRRTRADAVIAEIERFVTMGRRG